MTHPPGRPPGRPQRRHGGPVLGVRGGVRGPDLAKHRRVRGREGAFSLGIQPDEDGAPVRADRRDLYGRGAAGTPRPADGDNAQQREHRRGRQPDRTEVPAARGRWSRTAGQAEQRGGPAGGEQRRTEVRRPRRILAERRRHDLRKRAWRYLWPRLPGQEVDAQSAEGPDIVGGERRVGDVQSLDPGP